MAYNTLLEVAEVVSKKIFSHTKNHSFQFDLLDVHQKVVYRYELSMRYYSFTDYGDYNVRYDETTNGCKRFHENKFLPVLVDTIYPEGKAPVQRYWGGDKIDGLFRKDVGQYVYGNLEHL